MSEINALADVLQIGLNTSSFRLEVVPATPPKPEDTARHQLVARQRALNAVSRALRVATAQLSSTAIEAARFNCELTELSRSWRLRTVGDVLLCDFGNRALGGSFMPKCEAEVIASTSGPASETAAEPASGLKILIPGLYRGACGGGLSCVIQADDEATTITPMQSHFQPPPGSAGWRSQLAAANQASFTHELFMVLQREATVWHTGSKSVSPRQFSVTLHRSAELSVTLPFSGRECGNQATTDSPLSRGAKLGAVLSLVMAMKLRRLQRAHAIGGSPILHEAAGITTADETRACAAVVLQSVAAEIKATCTLSRLHVRWDVRSVPWTPTCRLTFVSLTNGEDSLLHRHNVEISIGRGSYAALDRHNPPSGARQFWVYSDAAFRAFLMSQWQMHQMNAAQHELETLGFEVERRSGLSSRPGTTYARAYRHALSNISFLLLRDPRGVCVSVNSDTDSRAGESTLWVHLAGSSPRHRVHAALRGHRRAQKNSV